jgi:hypothetical protein
MGKITDSIQQSTNDNVDVQRRRFARRSTDTCLITVNGMPYPVKDWSLSGVLFEADTRTFNAGDTLPMELKFRVGDEMAMVEVTGQVVRKNALYVATQFDELPTKTQQTLHTVIDKSNQLQQAQKNA